MFPQIKTGLSFFIKKIVLPEDSAIHYESGLIKVFATPAMVALMEKTALECVNHLLPEGNTTVGTAINIQHTKATSIGKKVKSTAKVVEVDRKKIVFEVSVEDEQNQIGFGTHTRFVINQAEFMAKLN